MATFNNESISDGKLRVNANKECGMYLAACLPEEEYKRLQEDWKKAGGFKVISWWKFALDNIKVSYSS